jgi:dienelactone hydrolase
MVDNITAQFRFDIDLISQRLLDVTYYVDKNPITKRLPIGYFGASTGAAAAISAATKLPQKICAIVSRGGRPDLVEEDLPDILCPTLFIIGGHDFLVMDVNKQAFKKLIHVHHKDIKIIPKATHLFEEPGALEKVAKEASDWFIKYL